ncbi:Ribonuclease D [Commensalibacter sp. Nvir]|uniref:ribonuclease D n=1 Tax=Commensalibacter sp. Nvir TaxID=3069817 RepID=UPI002D4E241B|nr:Ribonuclease D [Commensalibacter sp. Nvir]
MNRLHQFSLPLLINDNASLQLSVNALLQEKFITLDTEFVRERTYWPQLCLLQIAGSNATYLIDTLADELDLTLLLPLLTSQNVMKVLHGAAQDLEIFMNLFGVLPAPVFDTQIASMVAGFGNQIGYDTLVESLLKVKIDKSHRYSDWSIRPLTVEQQNYASSDVTYLREVYQILLKQLQGTNRLSWVDSEMKILMDPFLYTPSIEKMWKRLCPRTHNRRVLGCLYAVLEWRENVAQQYNKPRQHILRDESVITIAASLPDQEKALSRIRGVSSNLIESKEGQSLLKIIKETKVKPLRDLPLPSLEKSSVEKPPEALTALLKVLLQAKCEEFKVAPKLVASTKDIEKLALGSRDLVMLEGWRRDVFGKDALDLCEGHLILGVKGQKVELIRC